MQTAPVESDPVCLQFSRVTKEFGHRAGWLRSDTLVTAVDDVTLTLYKGESFGLVGESGSGKTTLGRLALCFERPTSGTVLFKGKDVNHLGGSELKAFRRQVQMIFQNPFSSLNPRRSVRDILSAGYSIHQIAQGRERERRISDLLERVGLRSDMLDRYPHQFSGGQRQRIVVARALSLGPELIVADEPVSALDVSIQAQVLNLLKSLREEYRLTYLLITHDLRVVSSFCARVGVMYLGRLVELGERDQLISQPLHPYTRVLISAAPSGDVRKQARAIVKGDITAGDQDRKGCVFSHRCWLKRALNHPSQCETDRPPLREIHAGRFAACHFAEQAPSTVFMDPLAKSVTEGTP